MPRDCLSRKLLLPRGQVPPLIPYTESLTGISVCIHHSVIPPPSEKLHFLRPLSLEVAEKSIIVMEEEPNHEFSIQSVCFIEDEAGVPGLPLGAGPHPDILVPIDVCIANDRAIPAGA